MGKLPLCPVKKPNRTFNISYRIHLKPIGRLGSASPPLPSASLFPSGNTNIYVRITHATDDDDDDDDKSFFHCSFKTQRLLTGKDECDEAEDAVAAEDDDARQNDVSGERLDVLDEHRLRLLTTDHHHLLVLLLRRVHAVARRAVRRLMVISQHRLSVSRWVQSRASCCWWWWWWWIL